MPLSEYEQRVLDQLEQQLASEDPKLESRMTAPATPRRGRIALGLGIGLAGLAALVIGLVVSIIWISMAGFVVMFVGAYLALTGPRGAKGTPAAPSTGSSPTGSTGPRKSKLQERFDRRMEERDE